MKPFLQDFALKRQNEKNTKNGGTNEQSGNNGKNAADETAWNVKGIP